MRENVYSGRNRPVYIQSEAEEIPNGFQICSYAGRSKAQKELGAFCKGIPRVKFVTHDELSYALFDIEGARLMFQIAEDCYERKLGHNYEYRIWKVGSGLW